MHAASVWSRSKLGDVLGIALTALGILGTAIRVFRPTNLQQDFAFVYVAGRTWLGGLNPYTFEYLQVSKSLFYRGSWPTNWFFPPEIWVYPPQWSTISMPLALLPFHEAALVWQMVTGLSIVISIFILWKCSDALQHPPSLLLKGIFAIVLMTGESAHWNIWLGQTGSIVLLGFSAVLYGLAHQRRSLLAIGLTLLLLKPQIGIAFLLIGLWEKEQRLAAIVAAGATLLACIPVLLATNLNELPRYLPAYLHNLHEYVTSAPNVPQAMTGIGQLFYYMDLPPVPGPLYPFIAALLALVGLHISKPIGLQSYLLRYWGMALLMMAVVIPLHGNDLMALPSILLLAPSMDLIGWICAGLSACLLYRPGDVFRRLAPDHTQFSWSARVEAIAAALLAIALYRAFAARRGRPNQIDAESGVVA